MPNRLAFIFYALLCVLMFALLVLAYVPRAAGFMLWLFTPAVERTGG